MEKGLLSFLKYSLLLVGLFMCFSCNNGNTKTTSIKEYIQEQHGIKVKNDINRIFFINDQGCGNCIRHFSEYIKEHVEDDHSMIILNSRGNNLDIDAFKNKKNSNPNILISYDIIRDEEAPLYNSGVVYMKGNEIDTIIYIDSENLFRQMYYIDSRNLK